VGAGVRSFDSGSPRNADEISTSSFNRSKSLALNTAPLFRNARSYSGFTNGALWSVPSAPEHRIAQFAGRAARASVRGLRDQGQLSDLSDRSRRPAEIGRSRVRSAVC